MVGDGDGGDGGVVGGGNEKLVFEGAPVLLIGRERRGSRWCSDGWEGRDFCCHGVLVLLSHSKLAFSITERRKW